MITAQNLKNYLQEHGSTTLLRLSQYFNDSPEYILFIAEHYIAKGKIYCEKQNINCGTKCSSCIASSLIKLSWNN